MLQNTSLWACQTLAVCCLHMKRLDPVIFFFSCDMSVSSAYKRELFSLGFLLNMQKSAPPHVSLVDWQSDKLYFTSTSAFVAQGSKGFRVIWKSAKQFCEIRRFCVTVVAVWFIGLQFKQTSSSQELVGQSGIVRDAERESTFHRNDLHRSQLSFFPAARCAVSILKLWFSRTVYIKKNIAESVQKH